MPESAPAPFLSTCPVCQESIDVTALEPFSKIACPHCGQLVRVRRNFDHFRIIKQIGEGGMSRVFEAEDETLGRRVALKILNRQFSQDAARVEQFRREALVTARISHLNVIKLYSTGDDHGYFYIAMELVGGGSLEQRIKNLDRLAEEDVLRIGLEVAEGLRAAQREGLLHRDVKPANILFTNTGTAKVVDFGLAIFADSTDDDGGEIWATPYYVAPEKVIDNREDARSDIFSLGATLYHALTGKPPHKANTASLTDLRRIKAQKVNLEDTGLSFSPRTAQVINRMLAIAPESRTPDYDSVVEDLRVAQRLIGSRRHLTWGRREKFLIGAAVAVVAAFVVGWMARSTGQRAVRSIRGGPAIEISTVATQTPGQATVSERFRQARDQLVAGKTEAAQKQFELLINEGLRQPTLNWARFHVAVCAMEQGDQAAAKKVIAQMREDPGTGEAADFFKRLSACLADKWGGTKSPADLAFARDKEEVAGYLLCGLAQWHFGDPARAAELLHFFFDSMPAVKAAAAGLTGTAEWIPAYAAGFEQRYRPDLELAAKLDGLEAEQEAAAVRAQLQRLERLRSELRTNGVVKTTLDRHLQELRREEVRLRLADRQKEQEAARARRQRELEQLKELDGLLPVLIQGYDYSKALEVLQGIRLQTTEVRAALEAKVYLYGQAQAFMEQLGRDLAARPWQGLVRRQDGASVEGRVTAINLKETSIAFERGVAAVPTAQIAPETLVDIATAQVAETTDSTDYYRRQEMIAVFARLTGLQSVSSAVAASLMEENREFRMRWLKVL